MEQAHRGRIGGCRVVPGSALGGEPDIDRATGQVGPQALAAQLTAVPVDSSDHPVEADAGRAVGTRPQPDQDELRAAVRKRGPVSHS